MNIKRAKQEIKDTIEAYLLKDEYGAYVIPQIRQRPVLLLGAPGIGKTQIMEQIARECGIALVAYTITHHTRQSAIGLPFVSRKNFGGHEYAVTEYTMSEIVAALYGKMEKTGLREGILFIDEINCVSETLAPAMLQFLQCKTFGSHEIPQGWIIVAAGNPPEYNKSVREFDVVTMDRVKKIEVEPDFAVWKEYAVRQQLHPAVIAYLDARPGNFYKMETTVDGRKFATPRGWEDFSQMLEVYEQLGKTMDREVVVQYIQHETIAKDFANYLELYHKYQMDYQLEAVLSGTIDPILIQKAAHAPFDERLSVVSLLLARCRNRFAELARGEETMELLFAQLKVLKERLLGGAVSEYDKYALTEAENPADGGADNRNPADSKMNSKNPADSKMNSKNFADREMDDRNPAFREMGGSVRRADLLLQEIIDELQRECDRKRTAELLTRQEEKRYRMVLETLEMYCRKLREADTGVYQNTDAAAAMENAQNAGTAITMKSVQNTSTAADMESTQTADTAGTSEKTWYATETETAEKDFALVKSWFDAQQDQLDEEFQEAGAMLEHAFDFLEAAFGAGQELVIFITELNQDYYSVRFLQEYECERYYRYNRELLFEEGSRAIEARLQALGR